ncbi:TPA: CD1375 family protein [Streptococcus suis]
MMINYFAMQVQLGWITLEQVPKRYREKVRELVEMSEIGITEDGN